MQDALPIEMFSVVPEKEGDVGKPIHAGVAVEMDVRRQLDQLVLEGHRLDWCPMHINRYSPRPEPLHIAGHEACVEEIVEVDLNEELAFGVLVLSFHG